MISNCLYEGIPLGTSLYKISSEHKKCEIAKIVGKYKGRTGNSFLAKLDQGGVEWVSYLNGFDDDVKQEPGWYLLV